VVLAAKRIANIVKGTEACVCARTARCRAERSRAAAEIGGALDADLGRAVTSRRCGRRSAGVLDRFFVDVLVADLTAVRVPTARAAARGRRACRVAALTEMVVDKSEIGVEQVENPFSADPALLFEGRGAVLRFREGLHGHF
jgi:hypothetical protein